MSDVIRRPTFNIKPSGQPTATSEPALNVALNLQIPFKNLVDAIAQSGGVTYLYILREIVDKKIEQLGGSKR